jgi:hypothetical protein
VDAFGEPPSGQGRFRAAQPSGTTNAAVELEKKYRAYEAHNLRLMNEAVALTGAKLLVMTEASSWMAAASSFYQDLRIPSGMLSFQDFHEFSVLMNDALLDAAREVGALTYDLAAEVNPHSNGPEGGRYIYDNMHYTPEGCRLVVSFVRSRASSPFRTRQVAVVLRRGSECRPAPGSRAFGSGWPAFSRTGIMSQSLSTVIAYAAVRVDPAC